MPLPPSTRLRPRMHRTQRPCPPAQDRPRQRPGLCSLVLTTSPGVKYYFSHCTGKATKIYSLQANTPVFISKNASITTLFSWVLSRRDTEEDTQVSSHTNKTRNCEQSSDSGRKARRAECRVPGERGKGATGGLSVKSRKD